MMRPPRGLLLLALAMAFCTAGGVAAQTQPDQCNILENQRVERRLEAGVPTIFVTGPFLIRCPGGEELRAQQGVVNEWTREIVLTGNVFFQDPTRTLTASQATYWASLGRLYATGNVVFTDRQEGSTIRGPELEYFREMEGRPEAQVNAAQRPNLILQPREAAADAEPLEIDADRISIRGQNNLSAFGDVVIRRTDLHATAGEAYYNADAESLELRQAARIRSEQFNLSGETVFARMPEGELEHVHARRDAVLVGEELRVDADDLQLFFAEELLQRAVARAELTADGTRAGRAVATARAFRLQGDSIDALTPNQRVDQVIAIGRARGESVDTTATSPVFDEDVMPEDMAAAPLAAADTSELGAVAFLVDRDWIVGDTIIGYFEQPEPDSLTAEAADTSAVLRRIVAHGMAQSLYRAEQDGATEDGRRGINYLAGQLIELTFEAGDLQVAEVTGLRRGIYLDPVPDDTTTPSPEPDDGPTVARRGGR